MICSQFDKALESVVAGYAHDQIVVVADEAVMGDELWVSGAWPTLRLHVNEQDKSLATVQLMWDFFFSQGLTRRGLVIAVGGGVLTDMAGFAAATYKRGIDYVNIPTTLLAMIDASSGGKTGINYHGLKNSIGVFAEPIETIIWPKWLKSLPSKEMLSGFGEMLKTGLIESTEYRIQNTDRLWDRLFVYDLETMPIEELTPLIAQCVAVKEGIVAADPKEEGMRKALNFGHTFGHALEEVSILSPQGARLFQNSVFSSQIPHGYAVVYGMIAELYLSVTKLGCPKEPLQQLTQLMLHYYGKPQCKCSDYDRLIALMQQDKKNEHAGEINCTLIRSIGEPVINQVISAKEACEALDYLFSL